MIEDNKGLGIYVHVPFCSSKCSYCDFYSFVPQGQADNNGDYLSALKREFKKYSGEDRQVGSIYFGGGTPGVMGADWLAEVLDGIYSSFKISEHAEITAELNPADGDQDFFIKLREAGFNRISMGMQSANQAELKTLGRRHSNLDVERSVELARLAGFDNISLDLMLGLPGMGLEELEHSIDFAAGLKVQHISAYILKLEEGTALYKNRHNLDLPDDDKTADLYLHAVNSLNAKGYEQYEISNFSRSGYESRHNLIYWRCKEYLGFGPSAHSFYMGRRFYYSRDIKSFIQGCEPVEDGAGGGMEEFIMLKLRLSEGIAKDELPRQIFNNLLEAAKLCPNDYITADERGIKLTPSGFLISNAIIGRLIEAI